METSCSILSTGKPSEYYLCLMHKSDKTEETGYGADIDEARKSALEYCDRWFPTESQRIRRVRNSYGNYYC